MRRSSAKRPRLGRLEVLPDKAILRADAKVAAVLGSPGQTKTIRPGRAVYQSRVASGNPAKLYVVRIVVDTDPQPAEVVTVYRTSKVQKYWRGDA